MKSISYRWMIIVTIVIATAASGCAKKVIMESDHRHPHIKKRHPHERPQPQTDVQIKP